MSRDHQEQRHCQRHDWRVPCEFQIAGQGKRGFITNISATGFFILTSSGAEEGAAILVKFELEAEVPIVITGRVVRRRVVHRATSSVNQAGLGVQIESAPEAYYRFVMELEASA